MWLTAQGGMVQGAPQDIKKKVISLLNKFSKVKSPP